MQPLEGADDMPSKRHALGGKYLPLEVAWVPNLPEELPKALHQDRLGGGVVGGVQKVVPDGHDSSQYLHSHIDIVIVLHVVEANKAGHVLLALQGARPHHFPI